MLKNSHGILEEGQVDYVSCLSTVFYRNYKEACI